MTGILLLLPLIPMAFFFVYLRKRRQIIQSVTSLTRGESSERDLIYRLVREGIPNHTIFHDIYVPTKSGYAQIDLVVPTRVGVFVFEVKDYSGWIFGNGKHGKWTQVLAYGQEKHQFYNPIRQNARHIEALRQALPQLQHVPCYSIIVFYGSSSIRALSNVPFNCRVAYPKEAVNLITTAMQRLSPARYTDKWEIMNALKRFKVNGDNPAIVAGHLRRARMAGYGKYRSTYAYAPRYMRGWRWLGRF